VDGTNSSPRTWSHDSLDTDDSLGAFQDSLQSFPPEHPVTATRSTLRLSGGDAGSQDTLTERAISLVVAILALVLLAGAVYVGIR
jgi:hypothetical protein